MAKKKKTEPEVVPETGMVLYTDGGCRPGGRGIGGWGFHGYSYEVKPTKPTKKENAVTNKGYFNIALSEGSFDDAGYWSQRVPNKDFDATITSVSNYHDSWGSIIPESTNNIAELKAFQKAIKLIDSKSPKEATIWLDSEYVLNSATNWHVKWEANNWMTAAGKPVSNAELWKEVLAEFKDVKTRVNIHMDWVRGHAGDLGNEQADRNATRGVILGRKGEDREVEEEVSPKSYWNKKNPYNRLLAFQNWYFVCNRPTDTLNDGRTIYAIGAHGPKLHQCGKRASDQGYAVVALKEPEPVLETIRSFQNTDCSHSYERVVVADLSKILLPDEYHDLTTYGSDYLVRWTHLNDAYNAKEDRLTEEIETPLLLFRKVEQLSALTNRLEDYVQGKGEFVKTDITDFFFEQVTKGKKEVTALSKNIKQSVKSIEVVAKCDLSDEAATTAVTLNIGFDLPNRNALNALAEGSPKITLLLERESKLSFRYWTVIEVGDDVGIWSSIYANQKILLD